MATLKEIKTRIQSVKSTQKITSAMKMVSSAKLRKAEKSIENSSFYKESLLSIQDDLLCDNPSYKSTIMEVRELSKVALVVFSSNSSLCGSFNSNIIKELYATIDRYAKEEIACEVIPIGKKAANACRKIGLKVPSNYEALIDKPNYSDAEKIAKILISTFNSKQFDKVDLLYYQYHSIANQKIVSQCFLPYVFDEATINSKPKENYIFEPVSTKMLDHLLQQVLKMNFFQALLNTVTSEHAARSNSMQIATENANDLLQELSLQFNKSRQQAITNELLDILGGSFK